MRTFKKMLVALVLVGCAHNVPQDLKTGPDGREKGAVPIALENNAGTAHGIVTYPGGDRVDWKSIQIPEGAHGKLELSLSWKTPRPGLHVAFDVFDQWNTLISKAALHKEEGHTQMTTLPVKQGTYFVRVFAPKRGDAGEYKLEANFTPDIDHPNPLVDIPDPPKLPAVPVAEKACAPFDPAIPACHDVCPDSGAPANWKPCVDRDKKAAEEAARDAAYKECLERQKNGPKPVDKRILAASQEGDMVKVSLGGSDVIDTSWTAQVLNGDSGTPLSGGTVTISRVNKTQTIGKVKLTTDTLNRNPTIRFTPPKPETCTR